ncbi:MAG: 2'-5' RNA ligase family protein [Clostridiales bacterium]|nr:2'-5' RNA ligase family protein [Clostridiales bacterium]
MNYVNKGLRDVLIIPELENVSLIQEIREKYDELADIVPPHITLAFPFDSDITNEELDKKLQKIFSEYTEFSITLSGVSYHYDERVGVYYIYLDVTQGRDTIYEISQKIYRELFNKEVPEKYIPHITLGSVEEINNIKLDHVFHSTVKNIIVEDIGENEESNIILNYSL